MTKESNEKLEMDVFDQDGIELNFDTNIPEKSKEGEEQPFIDNKEIEGKKPEEKNIKENINQDKKTPSEDENPEEVATEEDKSREDSSEENGDSSGSSEDTSNLYSSFATVLHEKGLLPSLNLEDNKISDVDSLTDTIKSEIDNQSKQYIIEKIGEDGYNALEKGVSLSEYQSYQNTINTLDNLNEESLENDIELAKNLIMQDYISQGMPEERANKILKKSIDLGDDIVLEDAKESLESLKAIQKNKMEALKKEREDNKKNQIKKQEKIDNDLKNSIYNSQEIIKGLKPSKAMKDKVYNSITKIVGQDENGINENKLMRQRRENPIEFDTKLYYLYELTDGFTDFSNLMNKTESKAISKLEKEMRKNKFESGSNPNYIKDSESYGGIGEDSELVL